LAESSAVDVIAAKVTMGDVRAECGSGRTISFCDEVGQKLRESAARDQAAAFKASLAGSPA